MLYMDGSYVHGSLCPPSSSDSSYFLGVNRVSMRDLHHQISLRDRIALVDKDSLDLPRDR